jgi:flagellar motor component MotA
MTHDEFIVEYQKLAPRIIELYETSEKNGLLALEEMINGEKAGQRDILEYSIRFIVNGMDKAFLEKILSNIVRQEEDKYTRLLMEIKKEAALQLQEGSNLYSCIHLFNSYTDITPLEDDPIVKLLLEEANEED